ncbi:hypothetical protein [Nonomuraea angiospora]|uniref:hypothetical protein n=1 Tax=Nonomuraea angiospora TaxID=46172 RepID=UPI0029B5887B|nr:hypothetical protein [Nonomuraea angiospora]MDX3101756.1 hypothetical protein [Nonomuraea angiospora]
MAFRLQALFDLEAEITNPLDLTTVSAPLSMARQLTLAQGTGAGQADMIWSDSFTIAASGTQAVDLAGTLVGPFGTTLTFARIKAVIVAAASGNTNNVNVVSDATNGPLLFLAKGDGYPVKPGGLFVAYDPSAAGTVITAGTADLINLVNSAGGTSVTCDVVIVGASA